MSNTEWLILQVIGDILALWLCWVLYPHLRDMVYKKSSKYEPDEHEDIDSARG